MNALQELHRRKMTGAGQEFDPAMSLVRLFELREIVVYVANWGECPPPEMLDKRDICGALETQPHAIQKLFDRHVTSMTGFMEAGLKAIESARADECFNTAAARSLYREYRLAEKTLLALVGR
ncbi:hypothetical protein [Sphingorhabdus sp. Alg239-R122]|uniref:hypothetical protein n=1 Tax=Sphingorhabdus sp. Alg239-R122 TaxID=2305989 RepID=UPI0013DB03C5|nr:hypothetical protein [Sphingorhabdus sp. Alg239-R122]